MLAFLVLSNLHNTIVLVNCWLIVTDWICRWWCRASCPRMLVDILGTNCNQCRSSVQCCFTSTETVRLIRTGSPGRPLRLSHSSWTLIESANKLVQSLYCWTRTPPHSGLSKSTTSWFSLCIVEPGSHYIVGWVNWQQAGSVPVWLNQYTTT